MTEEKLPRELPIVTFDCLVQRNADQLLYDALWAENERQHKLHTEAMTTLVKGYEAELANDN